MTETSRKEEPTNSVILDHVIDMRGDLSSIIEKLDSMDDHGSRIESLETTKKVMYGCVATVSTFLTALWFVFEEKENRKNKHKSQ